jgi:hypothetical protein
MIFPVPIGRYALQLICKVIVVLYFGMALISFGCDAGTMPNGNGNTNKPSNVNQRTNSNTKVNSNSGPQNSNSGGFDIDREMQSMSEGAVITEVPEAMNVGETRTVVLVLTPDVTKAEDTEKDLKKDLEKRSEQSPRKKLGSTTAIQTEKSQFSRFMEAKLSGQGFEVKSITPERQPVTNNQNTEWKWEVKAAASGEQTLYLAANAIFEIDGQEKVRSINTYNKVIRVATVTVPFTEKIGTFISAYWQWIVGTLIIPLLGWGATRFAKKKE